MEINGDTTVKASNRVMPNILFIVQDDTGFGQLGCYGSPIATPNINALAKNGLLFTNMHTTGLCAPTRSCILTGRNDHASARTALSNSISGVSSGASIPFENGFLSEMLLQHGYNTYAVGKWHLAPADQTSAIGPYDQRPLGRGFERYYGFLGGSTNQYYPELIYDNHAVQPEKTPEQGYHLTGDLVDKAISFIADSKQVAPNKPFFLYFAPGAMHAPHHVPKEWADKYKKKFDDGWDVYRERVFKRQKELGIIPRDAELSPRDPDAPEWSTLSPDEKKLYARMMEVFAGFLTHTDHEYGRLFNFLKLIGQWENLLIMFISESGASSDGGPMGTVNENKVLNNVPNSLQENLRRIDELGGPSTLNHYARGWTFAGNTPFRRWTRDAYNASSSFIVHWPEGIKSKGEMRSQFSHANDIVPTVLDVLGIKAPASIKGVSQSPIEGHSFAHVLDNAGAPTKHVTQWIEMFGRRSIYHDGWRAVCPCAGTSTKESTAAEADNNKPAEIDTRGWELYHVEKDVAETHDLATQNKAKLIELIDKWYAEAAKHTAANPIHLEEEDRPQFDEGRRSYTYYPGTQMVPTNAGPPLINRPHSITADVEIPKGGAEGALLSAGDVQGGYALYVQGGKLHYVYNYVGSQYFHVESNVSIPQGRHKLRLEFEVAGEPDITLGKGAPGRAQLYIDGRLVGQGGIPVTMPISIGNAGGIVCGADFGLPVWDKYKPPFKFTGTIYSVTVEVTGQKRSSQSTRVTTNQAIE